MTRFKMIVLAAGLLAPLPLIGALPVASQTPGMAGSEQSAGRSHDGRLLSFLTPEQRAAFRIEARQEAREQMRAWRKALFVALANNTASQAEFLYLPDDRTVVMGARVDI